MSDPITLRYETAGMVELRKLLTSNGLSDENVDTFKTCMIILEQNGIILDQRQ
jgi:hypothetical protein